MIFPAFGKILVLANAFFYSNSNEKSIENIFSSFWQDLGFGEWFFSLELLIKKYWKIDFFPAFGKILVLVNVFFYSNSNEKVLKTWFFQRLARSWFRWMFFSIQILIKKVLKTWFFQRLARSWFRWMLFSIQILIKKKYWNIYFQLVARYLYIYIYKYEIVSYDMLIKIFASLGWFCRYFQGFGHSGLEFRMTRRGGAF